jgi:hypothetical protein
VYLWLKGGVWSVQQLPMAVNVDILDLELYFSIQVAPWSYVQHESRNVHN